MINLVLKTKELQYFSHSNYSLYRVFIVDYFDNLQIIKFYYYYSELEYYNFQYLFISFSLTPVIPE